MTLNQTKRKDLSLSL